MQVHSYGLARHLGKSIGHRDNGRLMDFRYILKIFGRVLQKRLFSGSLISKIGRQSETAQEVVCRLVKGSRTSVGELYFVSCTFVSASVRMPLRISSLLAKYLLHCSIAIRLPKMRMAECMYAPRSCVARFGYRGPRT
jgi:hypothetical protein